LSAALAICMAAAGSAGAETVVVSPNAMNGWSIAIQQGTGSTAPIGEFIQGLAGPPAGGGSFHMKTPYSHSDPLPKVYIGTNDFNGVSLSDITSFRVWTYLTSRGYETGQPPMVEIFTDSGLTTQQRRFVFYPWGQSAQQNAYFNTWQEWDLMSADGHWELIGTSSTNYTGNWDWVKSRYGDASHPMRFVQPPVGDYIPGVLTGAGINMKIGSGQAIDSRYGAWWWQSCQIDGCIDKFTIGVRGADTVFDFELDGPPPPVYGISNRAAYDVVTAQGSSRYRFMTWGTVQEDGFDEAEFLLDDGSDAPVRIFAPGHSAYVGGFVTAAGTLDTAAIPPTLNCDPFDVVLIW